MIAVNVGNALRAREIWARAFEPSSKDILGCTTRILSTSFHRWAIHPAVCFPIHEATTMTDQQNRRLIFGHPPGPTATAVEEKTAGRCCAYFVLEQSAND